MRTQPVTTFADLLANVDSVRPLNPEHIQARAAHVHAAVIQIITDGDFSEDIVSSFPVLARPHDRTMEEIGDWWSDFGKWWENLPMSVLRRINAENVIS